MKSTYRGKHRNIEYKSCRKFERPSSSELALT